MLFKLGLRNIKQNLFMNVLIVLQMTVVFTIAIFMVSTIVSRFQLYMPLKDKLNIAVMEADIDGECDANTIEKKCGVEVVQLHTGGMCHLDADMTRQGLNSLEGKNIDLAILENVGNLVCPAEFDTGSSKNAMILSVPEGDDKPLKYPLMFTISDLVIINKIDTLCVFDFDIEKAKERILKLNKNATIIPISAKTGEGIDQVAEWLINQVNSWKK